MGGKQFAARLSHHLRGCAAAIASRADDNRRHGHSRRRETCEACGKRGYDYW
ncbi:hypothetical protein SJ05684_c06430 [Sinorhizobium sojae CCBAU 05684]|uniref:Uncharacterized protein n=1 Tax=Sinorhizobium sojae CCBAU 05684 TaxID=716928 RepID=A0A249P8S3_9HYPH|nr:hypothetical protein SJ05684_c06430 [Sinorhizobium sojae CCBAU 05684]